MTTQTHIQLKLQPDSGSIFYQDSEDGVVFHIEAMAAFSPPPSHSQSSNDSIDAWMSRRYSPPPYYHTFNTTNGTAAAGGEEEEPARKAQTDLIKSFLRQHLVKNGEDSRCLIPMMHKDSIEALLIAMVGLHLRKDGGGLAHRRGSGGVMCGAGAAVGTLHKTLGTLVSMLQQREKALRYVEANMGTGYDGYGEEFGSDEGRG
ncbi:hypothetical protein VP1G_07584 [Cytospora mali]|uniref:Uncharacterized protein n=1 Tax=Cytospora mali TaxID=578113 RepID=A0A194V8P3_CYTMA|nr:hypothetical protein VP1G_07584 [Valsa mali var. pyri (nom. inval.)]